MVGKQPIPNNKRKRQHVDDFQVTTSTALKWQEDSNLKSIPDLWKLLDTKRLDRLKIDDFKQIYKYVATSAFSGDFWINVLKNLPCNVFTVKGATKGDRLPTTADSITDVTVSGFIVRNSGALTEKSVKEGWKTFIDSLNCRLEHPPEGPEDSRSYKRTKNLLFNSCLKALIYYSTTKCDQLNHIDGYQCRLVVMDKFINPLDMFFTTVIPLTKEAALLNMSVTINNFQTQFSHTPAIPIFSYKGFGHIFVGEIKKPSLKQVVEFLEEKDSLSLGGNVFESEPKNHKAVLQQLFCDMIISECPLGLLTDGVLYIFIKIVGKCQSGFNFQFYVTKCNETYQEDPKISLPRSTFVSLMMNYLVMEKEEYKQHKDHIFGDMTTTFKTKLMDSVFDLESHKQFSDGEVVHPTYVAEQDLELLHFDPNYNSTVLRMKTQALDLDLEEEERLEHKQVIVKVFDALIHFPDLYKVKLGEVRHDMRTLFYNEITAYEQIQSFNEEQEWTQINMAEIFKYGFYCFRRDPKGHGVSNYIACGPTLVMEELKVKPKSNIDFKKGLIQLLLLHQAGITYGDVEYRNMFMQGDDFLFIDFGLSNSWVSGRRSNAEIADYHDYKRVWRETTKAPPEADIDMFKGKVIRILEGYASASRKRSALEALLVDDGQD